MKQSRMLKLWLHHQGKILGTISLALSLLVEVAWLQAQLPALLILIVAVIGLSIYGLGMYADNKIATFNLMLVQDPVQKQLEAQLNDSNQRLQRLKQELQINQPKLPGPQWTHLTSYLSKQLKTR